MLTHTYPPLLGGIEQHVRNLSNELTERGHQVAVVTLHQANTPDFELDGKIRIYRIRGTVQRASNLVFTNPERNYAPPFPDPELAAGIARILRTERPHIVHAHNWLVHSMLPLKALITTPLVVSLHDYNLVCAKWVLMYHRKPCSGPGFRKCIECSIQNYGIAKGLPTVAGTWAMRGIEQKMVDMFLPVSNAVAEGNRLTGGKVPYMVIPNFLPEHAIHPKSEDHYVAQLSQLPQEDYLLFVGAFARTKGVHVLLEAYAGLENPPPLVMIGYDTGEIPLRAGDLPPNVHIFKNWHHDAVMHAWKRSIAGLVPSIWAEPCATVVFEAMATGRPVIASRIGGLPDNVEDGVNGLLVPPEDPVALRQAISRLLADPALRTRLGEAGRQRFPAFQAGSVVGRIEQVYRDLLKARAKGVRR